MFIARLAITLGLTALSWHIGKEIQRSRPIRETLRRRRERLAREGKGMMRAERERKNG